MSEQVGKKGWLRYNDEGLYWISTIPLDASMDAADAISDEEGVFITLTELATRDAELIKAAEARGAAAEREMILKGIASHILDDEDCTTAIALFNTIKAQMIPDTAAQ